MSVRTQPGQIEFDLELAGSSAASVRVSAFSAAFESR